MPSSRYSKALVQVAFLVLAAFLALGGWFASPRSAGADIIILVDTANDVIANDSACSLREAITAANNNANYFGCIGSGGGYDLIEFSIGPGTPVINIATALPQITGPVEINGAPNRVELRGPGADNLFTPTGLNVGAGADGSIIRSMVVNNFDTGMRVGAANVKVAGNRVGTDASGMTAQPNTVGIVVEASGVVIGGTGGTSPGGACTGDCNLISGNLAAGGIDVNAFGLSGILIQGNYIGTNVLGAAALPNSGRGIRVVGGDVTIGYGGAAGRNVISGNSQSGVHLVEGFADVQENYIGVDSSGNQRVANLAPGVTIDADAYARIGYNVISGNNNWGICICASFGNYVDGNLIGTAANGVTPIPNRLGGIILDDATIDDATDNDIGGFNPNVIAFNGGDGISISGPFVRRNTVRSNSIHSNGGLGISLFDGANDGVLPPVISQVTATTVSGTGCTNCTIDVYSDSADEGRVYHGSTTADGGGNWSFPGVVVGPNVTATATNAGGSTSEFSAPFVDWDPDSDGLNNPSDNCPLWPNPAQNLPPWPVPFGDSDCDGFTDAAEVTLGTDPADQCPDDASDDAWPPDINMSGGVSVTDVLFLKPWFGQNVPPAPARYDLLRTSPATAINITDVVEFKKYFGLGCT